MREAQEDIPAITVEHLVKRYPRARHNAVDDVSFRVRRGETFGLLGPNGAGKTTTIGILTTLVRPNSGWASISGVDVAADSIGAKQRIAVVPQRIIPSTRSKRHGGCESRSPKRVLEVMRTDSTLGRRRTEATRCSSYTCAAHPRALPWLPATFSVPHIARAVASDGTRPGLLGIEDDVEMSMAAQDEVL